MRVAPTPAWTFIIVPPTPKAPTKRVGIRMRTVRVALMLSVALFSPLLVLSWSWMDTQVTTAATMADRIAAQEQMLSLLGDSLDAYRRAALEKHAANAPPAGMIMPLTGRITSWFARSRLHPILRVWRAHRGIDVAAAAGTRIVAPAAGIVASVGRKFGFGLTVEIVHGGGVTTRYAHLRSALVKPGDRVAQGAAIATVGASGLATAPHLHFEVLLKGKAVDPVKFLASTSTGASRSTGADSSMTPH